MTDPNQEKRPRGMTAEQVIAHYSERTPDGCLRWTKYVTETGAPLVRFDGRRHDVRRLAWESAFGPVPKSARFSSACHDAAAARGGCDGGPECPHRRCVEPTHLRLSVSRQEGVSEPVDPESAVGVGRAVRLARIAQDMTQPELDALAEVLRGRIVDAERHRLGRMGAHKVFAIAEVLDLGIDLDAIALAKRQVRAEMGAAALERG